MTLRSPLYEEHLSRGARLVDFAGWDMPLQFSGVVAEHRAVRERVGLFDVSHLGKLALTGPDAPALLDLVVTNGVASLAEWRARYNLVLTEGGGIVDDLFVYCRPDGYLVVPNAANAAAVLAAIQEQLDLKDWQVSLSDERERWAIMALQGNAARTMARSLMPSAVDLRLHSFGDFQLDGVTVQVARTGYTGEYGFELFVPWADAPRIWRLLLAEGEQHGILPVGLGARDTLRLEMGYPLHGHEISLETNPLEAGLGWTIDWSKSSFRGRPHLARLQAAGEPPRRLVGFSALGPGIPRADQAILAEGSRVGTVTSGNFSPLLGKGIGLGYVDAHCSEPGTRLEVDVRGKRVPVVVTATPFVPRGRAAVR